MSMAMARSSAKPAAGCGAAGMSDGRGRRCSHPGMTALTGDEMADHPEALQDPVGDLARSGGNLIK